MAMTKQAQKQAQKLEQRTDTGIEMDSGLVERQSGFSAPLAL
ncbi:MAG: hypothetical protein V4692_06515 [Bdellovibrionota bacterium]